MAKAFQAQLTEQYTYYPVAQVAGAESLPMSLKILAENILRNATDEAAAKAQVERIVAAAQAHAAGEEIDFAPARVLFQDFTGVPAFVDYAVMREACVGLGADPARINPQVPCNLIIDHSVIADEAGSEDALKANMALEATRNAERYTFLKWARGSFDNVEITPPGDGICHQLNIERYAHVVMTAEAKAGDDAAVAYFDTLVGTDSHTPTANGLGILGWGVGGIEAEAASLGQAITILVPRVIGVRLTGELTPGVSGMDVALRFAHELRKIGVVGAFVECFGPGVGQLSATQRTCISNMSPEYGCTCTLFPVDERTSDYLHLTGRSQAQCDLVETYAKAQGVWGTHDDASRYSAVLELDLSSVEPALAGPSRPHDLILASQAQIRFRTLCGERDLNLYRKQNVAGWELTHGAIAIAALTSCTTAADPAMMIAAALLARNAAEVGLTAKPWVKTIFAPGSHAISTALERAGLTEGLNACGFYCCGFGCMSCIGNSGPLSGAMHEVADKLELTAVLSGNRNFEGRISPDVSQNYLMAPALVVAYALAGTVDVNFALEPLGERPDGRPVYLRDIMPSQAEIDEAVATYITPDLFAAQAGEGSACAYSSSAWDALTAEPGDLFAWDEDSTYVRSAPYFEGLTPQPEALRPVENARVLALLGDFITTDHISPAGAIAPDSPAAKYLTERGVAAEDFNTYGSRRGNHEVMMRGTFANVKLQNLMTPGLRGGWTKSFADGGADMTVGAAPMATIFDAAEAYRKTETPLVVLAGKMYGSGSSRDWAAKGPLLLGVRAVVAESFERIHRSNLVGMGILPLEFTPGESAATLGLAGDERISIALPQGSLVGATAQVSALRPDGSQVTFNARLRIDTPTEEEYLRHGGILQYVLRNLV